MDANNALRIDVGDMVLVRNFNEMISAGILEKYNTDNIYDFIPIAKHPETGVLFDNEKKEMCGKSFTVSRIETLGDFIIFILKNEKTSKEWYFPHDTVEEYIEIKSSLFEDFFGA